MFSRILRRAAGLALLLPIFATAGGADIVNNQCAQCHALERPDFDAAGIEERLQRKAPPLYFAGNKYREEWLNSWLTSPSTIHPAGYFPQTAMTNTSQGDRLNPEALHKHQALDAATAKTVAAYLMSLRPYDDLVAQDKYTAGTVSARMGQMDFRKFKGCNACHQDAEGEGGVSGPVLYNAWLRLQPAYLSSFISNPTAWDPNTAMPVPQMNEAAAHKLVHYLRVIGGEE